MEKSNDRRRVDSSDNFFDTELPLFKGSEVRYGFSIITEKLTRPRAGDNLELEKHLEKHAIAPRVQFVVPVVTCGAHYRAVARIPS